MKRGESMRSRGYTLIEIAGVMAVLGILLGASLLPLNRQLRESEYRQERVNMERLSDAVLGYALRHRTPGVEIIMVNDDGTQDRGFYAKGRPYLPCPDGDGNGIEDRRDLISPVVQTLSRSFFPITPRRLEKEQERQDFIDLVNRGLADFADIPPPSQLGFHQTGQFLMNSPIRYSGACSFDKSQLPWRTLGSIPADYWGNRYTYFADPIFSQEATGFDEKTVADSGDRRVPLVIDLTLGYIPQNRIPVGGAPIQPSVICDIAEVAGNSLYCGRNGIVAAPATLIAGEPAPSDASSFLNSEAYFFQNRSNHIADGLPFVIVSHGHNGRGAFNHLLSRRERKLECRSFDDISVEEAVNVNFYFSQPFSDLDSLLNFIDEIDYDAISNLCNPGIYPDSPPHISRLFFDSGLIRRDGYFFAHRSDVSAARAASSISNPPLSLPDRPGIDDLLVWMTRGDLARRMREADVFPLILKDSDRPPVFYEPP